MAETNHDAVWVVDSEDVRNHVLHLGPGPDPPWQGHLVEVIFGHAQINLQLVFSSLFAGDQQRCGLWLPVLWQLTHSFNGPFLGTTQVSWWHFTEARDSVWQWHQLAVCKSASRSRQITTPIPHQSKFFTGRMPILRPNQRRQSTEASYCGNLSSVLSLCVSVCVSSSVCRAWLWFHRTSDPLYRHWQHPGYTQCSNMAAIDGGTLPCRRFHICCALPRVPSPRHFWHLGTESLFLVLSSCLYL